MKKIIILSIFGAVLIGIWATFDIRPLFYVDSTPHNAHSGDIPEKQLSRIFSKYQSSIPTQTPFYYGDELVHLTTPSASIVFAIKSKTHLDARIEPGEINGQQVNMVYPRAKYQYKYRTIKVGSETEQSGDGELVIDGSQELNLDINGVVFKLSYRSEQSLWLTHKSDWTPLVLELDMFDSWPIRSARPNSNQSLDSTPKSGAN